MPQVNEGTARLYRDYGPERMPPEKQEQGRIAANTPEANAKKAAWRKGKPIHPKALAALERCRGQKHSAETKRKIGQRLKQIGHLAALTAALILHTVPRHGVRVE